MRSGQRSPLVPRLALAAGGEVPARVGGTVRSSFGQPSDDQGVPESPAPGGGPSLPNCFKSGTQLLRKCLNDDFAGREEQLS